MSQLAQAVTPVKGEKLVYTAKDPHDGGPWKRHVAQF